MRESVYLFLAGSLATLLSLTGCDSSAVINDLSDASYRLRSQDNTEVIFHIAYRCQHPLAFRQIIAAGEKGKKNSPL